jgi:ABC-type transport system substrate-binding protein
VSGPFLLDSWLQGSRMVFRRNPRYWNAREIHLDKIVIDMHVDRDTAVLNFLRGDYDTVDRLSSDMYVRFARSPKWKPHIIVSPGMNSYGELMSERCDPRLNKQVRLAFNYALDKDDSRILSNGRYIVAHGIYPPGLPSYDANLAPYPHDVAKARALMAAGGYPHGFDITYTTLKDELQEKLAESIQSDLAEIGVRVHIQLVTFPAYLTAVGRNQLCFAYSAWVMDFPDPWDFIEVKFHSRYIGDTNASNDAAYKNPALDAVLDAARRERDAHKRVALYQEAERILYADPPWIWHYHSTWVEFLQPYVKGYAYHPVYQRDTRYVWLDR